MVATTILSVALVSLANLMASAIRANLSSRTTTRAVILAEQKMEQLKSLAWAVEDGGGRVSDVTSNVAVSTVDGVCAAAPTAAGAAVGLTPAPPETLAANTDGYVDYVDAQGCGLGGGPVPPPGSAYIRRWSIAVSDAGPDSLVLRVLVTQRGVRTAMSQDVSGRMPDDATLTGVKTRRTP